MWTGSTTLKFLGSSASQVQCLYKGIQVEVNLYTATDFTDTT